MKLKKTALTLIIVLLGSGYAMAQPGRQQNMQPGMQQGMQQGMQPDMQQGPPPIPGQKQVTAMIEELNTELELSESQYEEIGKLYRTHYGSLRKISTSEESRGLSPELVQERETKLNKHVKALLDKKQKRKYNKYLRKHRSEMPQRNSRPPQPPAGGQRPPR